MLCPNCRIQMQKYRHKNAMLDHCRNCKGFWFDLGELNYTLHQKRGNLNKKRLASLKKEGSEVTPSHIDRGVKMCPRCRVPMARKNYKMRSNVFIDECPACGGVWLDKGEFKGILKYDFLGRCREKALALAPVDEDDEKKKELKERQGYSAFSTQKKEDDFMEKYAGTGQAIVTEEKISLRGVVRGLNPVNFLVGRFFIPVEDDTISMGYPYLNISLIVVCCTVFFAQMTQLGDMEGFFGAYGFVPANFLSLGTFTSIFLHAGLFHLAFNMWFLWIFGDDVEARFSGIGYLLFFVACGLFANLFYAAFTSDYFTPLVGASGAIGGVLGAYLVFYPKSTIFFFGNGSWAACYYLVFWFGMQMVNAFLYAGEKGGVAWTAHIGGFLCGAYIAWVQKRRQGKYSY